LVATFCHLLFFIKEKRKRGVSEGGEGKEIFYDLKKCIKYIKEKRERGCSRGERERNFFMTSKWKKCIGLAVQS
jgi:hypothetical protein